MTPARRRQLTRDTCMIVVGLAATFMIVPLFEYVDLDNPAGSLPRWFGAAQIAFGLFMIPASMELVRWLFDRTRGS